MDEITSQMDEITSQKVAQLVTHGAFSPFGVVITDVLGKIKTVASQAVQHHTSFAQ